MLFLCFLGFGKEAQAVPTVPKAVVYFSTHFLGPVSDSVSNKLFRLFEEFYPQISLQIVYSDVDAIVNQFGFKDKISKLCMPNVIYKYTCELCKEFYIGKTCRQFRCRIREHCGRTIRTGKPCEEGGLVYSEIRNHCSQKHQAEVNPENFQILARLRCGNDLELLESLFQRSLKPKIMNQVQSVQLMSFENVTPPSIYPSHSN